MARAHVHEHAVCVVFRSNRSSSGGRCIGVFDTRVAARAALLRSVVDEVQSDMYAPSKRFNLYGGEWYDRWVNTGVSYYRIETWAKNDRSSQVAIEYAEDVEGIDGRLKVMIAADALSDADVEAMLARWKDQGIPAGMLAGRIPRGERAGPSREQWVAKYGKHELLCA